ncbi:MAG: DUF1385 domain-containing protein [Bacillota bacterium]|nr:DUF1385 domain-containing protein [Bacillota bacterium]
MAKFQYGGQAVIEGVMMRGQKEMAIAVQKNPEEIVIERQPLEPISKKYPVLGWPIIRGTVALIESMVIGMKALTFSANTVGVEEEEELTTWEMVLTIAAAFGLAILLFVVTPVVVANFTRDLLGDFGRSATEGILRVGLFIGYVMLIGRMKDISRVFQYHGAEHKVIHAYEAGDELTVENAQKYSCLHPRCGTSFILIVLFLTIVVFTFVGQTGPLMRIAIKISLMPIIAGFAYELIKISGKHAHQGWVKILIAPGLWMQKLTTKEPDEGQIKVAIEALNAVLEQEKQKDIGNEVERTCMTS